MLVALALVLSAAPLGALWWWRSQPFWTVQVRAYRPGPSTGPWRVIATRSGKHPTAASLERMVIAGMTEAWPMTRAKGLSVQLLWTAPAGERQEAWTEFGVGDRRMVDAMAPDERGRFFASAIPHLVSEARGRAWGRFGPIVAR